MLVRPSKAKQFFCLDSPTLGPEHPAPPEGRGPIVLASDSDDVDRRARVARLGASREEPFLVARARSAGSALLDFRAQLADEASALGACLSRKPPPALGAQGVLRTLGHSASPATRARATHFEPEPALRRAALSQLRARLARFPASETWRLVIDADRHAGGPLGFDEREPGYLAGMYNGLWLMLRTLGAPLDVPLLVALHDAAAEGVRCGQKKLPPAEEPRFGEFQAGLRRDQQLTTFGVIPCNASLEGIEELRRRVLKPAGLMGFSYFEQRPFLRPDSSGALPPVGHLRTRPVPQAALADKLEQVLAQHTEAMARCRDEAAALSQIAETVQTLEQLHPFMDGNIRTFAMLVLNKMLIEAGFSPVVMDEPNVFDGKSNAELVDAIREGQRAFARLKA